MKSLATSTNLGSMQERRNNMEIEKLIDLTDEISCELSRIQETIEPEEYESWFEDNLVQAHDLLCEVKDLIGA